MLFVDYVFDKIGNSILFDKELKPTELGVENNDLYSVRTDNDRIIFRKFDIEDTTIKLHEIARHIEKNMNQPEIAYQIRKIADQVSDKLKGKTHG